MKTATKKTAAVRCARFEIFRFANGDAERRDTWKTLAVRMQEISNRFWQVWELWHVQQGTVKAMRDYLERAKQWHDADKATRGDKPKYNGNGPMPPVLSSIIYRALADEFPDINARSRTVTQAILARGVTSRKSAHGALPGWWSILLCREARPSFRNPCPIVFDKQNGKLSVAPKTMATANGTTTRDVYRLTVRVERGAGGASLVDECELITHRRKMRGQVAILDRLISGEYKFSGSKLVFDDGKWYAMIAYQMPTAEKPEVDAEKVATLWPGRSSPWLLLIDGDLRRRGGTGSHVGAMRQRIFGERMSRQESYRWASSSTKGRGREKATAGWTKLTNRWRDYVKRYNHEVTRRIVNECVARGIGTLIYRQPKDERAATRFLATRGKSADIRDSSGWDFYQVLTLLRYKAADVGIEVRCE